MWRKDEPRAPSLPAQTKSTSATPASQSSSGDQTKTMPWLTGTTQEGRLTRSIIIVGEITGQDDLLIDGEVRGQIRLPGGKLTVGPEGRVTAEVEAREVIVRGEVQGMIKGRDRVHIAATGKVKGEISTNSFSIEEGAEVHGLRVNLGKEEQRPPERAIETVSKPGGTLQVPPAEKVSQVHV